MGILLNRYTIRLLLNIVINFGGLLTSSLQKIPRRRITLIYKHIFISQYILINCFPKTLSVHLPLSKLCTGMLIYLCLVRTGQVCLINEHLYSAPTLFLPQQLYPAFRGNTSNGILGTHKQYTVFLPTYLLPFKTTKVHGSQKLFVC